MKPPCRAGFSLLEVVLATAILAASAIVLAELASIGHAHANGAEEMAAVQLACQTKLNEILAGATPAEAVSETTLKDPPGWVYSVEVEPLSRAGFPPGLVEIRVIAARAPAEDGVIGNRPKKEFTLTHWIHAPESSQ